MLQGVHAETIIFASYQRTRSSLLDSGSLLNRSGSEIELPGTPPRRFRVRVRAMREVGKAISCELQLHEGKPGSAALMTVDLTFAPDNPNTRVKLRGTTARNLSPASPTQDELSRRLANQYARALLDQIAKGIEAPPPGRDRSTEPSEASDSARQNPGERAKKPKAVVGHVGDSVDAARRQGL